MEIANKIGQALSDFGEKWADAQERFMESNIGKVLNNALDTTLRVALPDVAEDIVIDAKDALFENGLVGGAKQIWSNIKEFGKSALGLVTGKFETVEQVQTATKSGGILDGISDLFDFALEKSVESGKISKSERQKIKSSKNSILKEIKGNISEEVDNQIKYVEKIEEYNEKWKTCFENKDLNGMKNANRNIQKYLEKTLPLETLLKEARKIEIMQNLVESTGNFEITEEEQELAGALVQVN